MKKNNIYNEIKRIISGAFSGIGIGYLIALCVSFSIKDGMFYPAPLEVLDKVGHVNAAGMLACYSALLGATFSGLGFVWRLEKWSLLKSSLFYFTINLFVMTFSGYKMYWFAHNPRGYIFFISIYVLIFVIIWVICYRNAKKNASELNSKLEDINK